MNSTHDFAQNYRGLLRARITSVRTPVDGPLADRPVYEWVEQSYDPDTGSEIDADSGRKGVYTDSTTFDGCLIDANDTELSENTIVWIKMKGLVTGLLVYETVTPAIRSVVEDDDNDGPISACSKLAGLLTTDCVLAEVVSANGACSDVPSAQALPLAWDAGDSRWESTDYFVTPVHTGPLAYHNNSGGKPYLKLLNTNGTDYYQFRHEGCQGGYDLFSGGGPLLCDGTSDTTCADNSILVRVACTACSDSIGQQCTTDPVPDPLCMEVTAATGGFAPLLGDKVPLNWFPGDNGGGGDGGWWAGEWVVGSTINPLYSNVSFYYEIDCDPAFSVGQAIPTGASFTSGQDLSSSAVITVSRNVTETPAFEATFTATVTGLSAGGQLLFAGETITNNGDSITFVLSEDATCVDNPGSCGCPGGFPPQGYQVIVQNVTGDAPYSGLEGVHDMPFVGGCDFSSAETGDRWKLTTASDGSATLVGTTDTGETVTFTRGTTPPFNCCSNTNFTYSSSSGTWSGPNTLTVVPLGPCEIIEPAEGGCCTAVLQPATPTNVALYLYLDGGTPYTGVAGFNTTTQETGLLPENGHVISGTVAKLQCRSGTFGLAVWDTSDTSGEPDDFFPADVHCEATCFTATWTDPVVLALFSVSGTVTTSVQYSTDNTTPCEEEEPGTWYCWSCAPPVGDPYYVCTDSLTSPNESECGLTPFSGPHDFESECDAACGP